MVRPKTIRFNGEMPLAKYAKLPRGEKIKLAGLHEYRFTQDWSFAKKGRRMFLEPSSSLVKYLSKKGILVKVKH